MFFGKNKQLKEQQESRHFFEWLNEHNEEIDDLYNKLMKFVKRNNLMNFLNYDKVYEKFIYFIYENSLGKFRNNILKVVKSNNYMINGESITNKEHISEIESTYECRYNDFIMNIHILFQDTCEVNYYDIYNGVKSAEPLYEFCNKYSTAKQEIYNEILNRKYEEEKILEEENYTNDDAYYTDEEN